MDTDKWKSIAVPIETWRKLNELAKENFRTVGGTITYLTQKEYESKKLVDEIRVPKKRLVDEKV